jgi:hypothetical protein
MGQGSHQEGFRNTGDSFNQTMVVGENDDERLIYNILLADNDLRYFLPCPKEYLMKPIQHAVHKTSQVIERLFKRQCALS